MRSLIVGGTSGLGLEIAKLLLAGGDEVIVTGRKNPDVAGIQFQKFDLDTGAALARSVADFVMPLPKIDRLVYAAGFYQDGNITQLDHADISRMLDVGLNAAIWFVREILQRQGGIGQFVAITSSAQYKPRVDEIIYTAVKAGLGQFANSLSLDDRVGKTMVAAPEGMKTNFWQATGRDTAGFNDPAWVATQVVEALAVPFRYAYVKILREPARTEVVETR
jgi:NAD(P)-dependent dehydrogenase (short-subunit alcohol dehydrogenase family)